MSQAMVPRAPAAIAREGFGEKTIEQRHETASTAIATKARAAIEARYVMALQRPRDEDDVRVKLLNECKRPGFAKKAFYSIPRKGAIGRLTGDRGRVEGLSVRFAETAIRIAGNISQSTTILYDDPFKRMINVAAIDLETNAVYERDLIVEKTVERRQPGEEDQVLERRTNSDGEIVYVIACTEAELLVKEANLVSRTFRTEAIRFIAADTVEECERQVVATVRQADAKDPDAARKELADAFATLAVEPSALKSYLGHELAASSPAELTQLRALYAAIREGAVTWSESYAEKVGAEGRETEAAAHGKKTVADKLEERQRRMQEEAKAKAAAQAQPTGKDAKQAPQPAKDAKASGAATARCFYCKQPLGGVAVEFEGPDGIVQKKHPNCTAFGEGREPGEG